MTQPWWCRISMQIAAESTDTAIDGLKIIMPTLAEQVAINLGIPVRLVQIDHWVVVPYMEIKK